MINNYFMIQEESSGAKEEKKSGARAVIKARGALSHRGNVGCLKLRMLKTYLSPSLGSKLLHLK